MNNISYGPWNYKQAKPYYYIEVTHNAYHNMVNKKTFGYPKVVNKNVKAKESCNKRHPININIITDTNR